ncbi:MAG: hypothetical protein AABW89_02430 [Nanoarchaeota archaeon]
MAISDKKEISTEMKRKKRFNRVYAIKKMAFYLFYSLELALMLSVIFMFSSFTFAGIGENVTVNTRLDVGAVPPEILSIQVNGGNGIDLTANSTSNTVVLVVARDFNGEANIQNVSVTFFDTLETTLGASDDNNNHYTNQTCSIDTTYGTAYEVNATCILPLQYYANNATWNASVVVMDNTSRTDTEGQLSYVNTLMAIGLPGSVDYGTVNGTDVSNERTLNVTNFGNALVNLSLQGYAVTQGDNLSMNCTLGNVQNISVYYQKYNLTASNTSGTMTLGQFESQYQNLTSLNTVRRFNLAQRRNDSDPYVDHVNATYWRIYVPMGVAGTCTGKLIFGSTVSSGS